jgi:hypothetical protein
MGKKNSSGPSDYNPNYGSSGKSAQKVPAYQLGTDNWTNANRSGSGGLGYQVGQSGSGKNVSAPRQINQQTVQSELAKQTTMADPAAVAANQAVSVGVGPSPAGTEGGGQYGTIGNYTRPGYDSMGNFLGELGPETGHRRLADGSYELINSGTPDLNPGVSTGGWNQNRGQTDTKRWQDMVNALRGLM